MKNIQKSASNAAKENLIPVTVRLSKSVYSGLKRISNEYGVSFAHTVRLAAECKLANYFGSVRYKDSLQSFEIMAAAEELAEICTDIVNNARRIGFNYSQELKLKAAMKRYNEICNDSSKGELVKKLAANEYITAKDEIEKTCLDKKELEHIIKRFVATAEKVNKLLWNIYA